MKETRTTLKDLILRSDKAFDIQFTFKSGRQQLIPFERQGDLTYDAATRPVVIHESRELSSNGRMLVCAKFAD